MKVRLLALLLLTISFSAFAQFGNPNPPPSPVLGPSPIDTAFMEQFDPPGPAQVITYNTNPSNTSTWNDTNFLWVSSPMSYHAQVVPFDTLVFETLPFSTLGNVFVRLKFQHICKITLFQKGFVEISTDGGTSWSNLDSANYKGKSPSFASLGYFNEMSYPAAGVEPYWGGPTNPSSNIQPDNMWWAEEQFDISDYAGTIDTVTGDTGFSDVRVRWKLVHSTPFPIIASGWYVDNILIEKAPCELQSPTIDWNLVPYQKPEDARYQSTETVSLKAKDAAKNDEGIDRVEIYYSINNAPWVTDTMTPSFGVTCPDSSEYSFTFTGLVLSDTIDWFINVFDCACPNITRDPLETTIPNFYTFWIAPAPPPICGPATPNSFPNVISTFPWVEDFESIKWSPGTGSGDNGNSHRGTIPVGNPPQGESWTVSPSTVQSSGYGWSVRQGPTSTLLTGPSSNNTIGGSNYLYTEASQGNFLDITQLITPCLDLSSMGCTGLEFYYHMYGSEMSILRVDIDTGHATPIWVNNVLKIQGQQNTSYGDPWNKAFVSLKDYAGKIIRVRFVGFRNNGTKGDLAIDDIRVYEPVPVNAEVGKYYTPQNGFCSYSNNEDVTVKVSYEGCNDITALPMAFTTEHLGTGLTVTTWDTIKKNISAGFDTLYTFPIGANLSAYGEYHISVFCSVPGDTILSNDSIGPMYIYHEVPYNNFPYFCTFDQAPWAPGNNTNTNPGTYDTTLFKLQHDPTSSDMSWYVGSDLTPTSNTGPRRDRSYYGNYLYTESSTGSNNRTLYYTNCVDLGTMTNPIMSFWYHMYGNSTAGLVVQIMEDGTNTWKNIVPNANVFAPQQTSEMDQWIYHRVDLSGYAGTVVKLRIGGARTNSGSTSDIAIDDLYIYDQPTVDVGITRISPPNIRVNLANPVKPTFYIRNYGRNPVSGIPIEYTITPVCGPNAGVPTNYTLTYTGTIQPNSEVTYQAPTAPSYPDGTFTISAKTVKVGDNLALNDSIFSRSVGWTTLGIQQDFYEDFDDCAGGTESGFFASGDLVIFDFGAPNNNSFTAASSLPHAAVSGLTHNYHNDKNEQLNLPRFIGFDTISNAMLTFKHRFRLGSGDAMNFQYNDVGGFKTLGFNGSDFCPDWYNDGNISALGGEPGWFGSSPGNQYISVCWPLSIFNFSTNPLSGRFNLVSDGGSAEGWAIDDFSITVPPQNSAHPAVINSEEYIIIPYQDNHIYVIIENTGAKKLKECKVQYSVDGGPYTNPELVTMPGNGLWPGERYKYVFNTIWNGPAPGPHTICVATSRPNDKQDNLPIDDTTCVILNTLDLINLETDSSYCNDFEDPSQVEWVALNTYYNWQGLVAWEKGTPNQAPINGAYSGNNAWMTNLTNNYKLRDSSSLITPVFEVLPPDSMKERVYEIKFWHNFKTEIYHDGGCLEASYDGDNWFSVGDGVVSDDWHNTDHVTSLDILKSGWTDATGSGDWQKASLKIEFDSIRNVVFRFRFASDYSFEYTGWAIDDFCFAQATGVPDYRIGQEEIDRQSFGVGNIIPNPTSGETYVPFIMTKSGSVKVSAYNLLGQQMMNKDVEYSSGENRVDFNVNNWEPGVYFVLFEFEGARFTRKMIVQ